MPSYDAFVGCHCYLGTGSLVILTFSRLCNVLFLKNMLSVQLELVNLDKRDSSGLYAGLFTLRFGLQAR